MKMTFDTRHNLAPAIMLALSLLLAACGNKAVAPEAKPAATPVADEETLVLTPAELEHAGLKVETLAPAAATATVNVSATIKPNQDRYARIVARTEGRVLSSPGALGMTVRAGQVLATLDSLAVGDAQLAYRQAAASQQVAAADFDRTRKLADEEIVPRRDLIRATGDLEKANAELRTAREKLRLLGATPATGEVAAVMAVRSPIAGEIVQKNASIGEQASSTEPMFTVADLSTVWIEANLSEELVSRVRAGASATAEVGALPGERFTGRVDYVAGALDPETRTGVARIVVANPQRRLKPEMFATVHIATGQQVPSVLSVPDAAVVLLQGQSTVFVALKNGYQPRPVQTGQRLNGRVVVTSGVSAGERVVVAGAYALKARLLKSQIGEE
ncbi:efflux RND transporter periplasmic adaptor subunit [Massilia arenosa]|uniref:Efflux RND transporter periplasmic adaptor subunit n=1 Tax=Zemynaea arenosa TaxID=2561931 RepID=A0A4Y9RWL3_9BURK|nr:efflux RND transporter periplasmic adaptor subunit [Massilia arenosa]TFW13362.1 efflux RND transporter periplasmic adaptor subunit [Massilia arenosa]